MYLDGLSLLMSDDISYNTRVKSWVDSDGIEHPYEMMISNRRMFRDKGVELSDFSKEVEWRLAYNEANEELYGNGFPKQKKGYVGEPDHEEALRASIRRARRKIYDYAICNPFDCFVTLTLDSREINRGDYSEVIKKLSTYLDNRVRRRGLIYLGVPELHKKGGLHFHFLMNSAALTLVDSGTVSVTGKKKPIKVETANRQGIPLSQRHTVYNIADWTLGFSTAIMTYGDRGAVAHYLSKELLKLVQKSVNTHGVQEKVGGRWYLSGGKLHKPVIRLDNVDYANVKGQTYDFDCPFAEMKVFVFKDDGSVLKL